MHDMDWEGQDLAEAAHVEVSALEKPLPRPDRDLLGYVSARALEALLEALLALEFLERGYTRNAAGKAFIAWRALTGTLLTLKRDEIATRLPSDAQKSWLRLWRFAAIKEGRGEVSIVIIPSAK